jgi:glycosyltransferase involved in cell wall biosynthesis
MKILYLSYTGLMEPLGRSQVLAYLKILSAEHSISLITFEKPQDMADEAAVAAMRQVCAEHAIGWKPQRYHSRPRLLATLWDLTVFAIAAGREVVLGRVELVHTRSYIPAFVALGLKWLLGVRFIFDMRAFWPEEMITAGRLERGSVLHRLLRWGERRCLREAAAVVSLTHAAVAHMKAQAPDGLADVKFVVIPTCADLERFRPPAVRPAGPRAVGCVGTVLSGWFRLDLLIAFFQQALAADPDVRLRIVTRDDHAEIRRRFEQAGLAREALSVVSCAPAEVPAALGELTVSAMFFDYAVSELARCPTRIAEALGCGVPVVANRGVGDVAEIVTRYRVGVLVDDASDAAMQRAIGELSVLLEDAGLADRCRAAAEDWSSLEKGAAEYGRLYAALAQGRNSRDW